MKRQSKAEEALRKQVKILETKMESIELAIKQNNRDLETTRSIRDQLNTEIFNLRAAREAASKRNTP